MSIMSAHNLKIESQYFNDVLSGEKQFEIRKNDRDFKVGDTLHLKEWSGSEYTGHSIVARISYMTDYEQKPGYVVLGIRTIGTASPMKESW